MSNVLDYFVLPEMPFLEELAEDLEGTFHVIAHAGYENNLRYIRNQQKYFSRKYGRFLDDVISDVGIFHIIPAYDTLQNLLDGNPTPDEIRQTAEECIYEHLNLGDYSEEQMEAFQDFYAEI
jgi:hypothetical protein